jgi:hypothetical protein
MPCVWLTLPPGDESDPPADFPTSFTYDMRTSLMILSRLFQASLALLLAAGVACAQQPLPYQPPVAIQFEQKAEPVPAPQLAPTVVPAVPCTQKVCVSEPKKNTKVVYSSHCKEYCLPSCSLWSLFSGGNCGCEGNCGEVRTRNVLVKKVVPTCDTTQCVLKEVPVAAGCLPCAPVGK